MLAEVAQVLQATPEATANSIKILDIGVITLIVKAAVDVGREAYRSRQERMKAKSIAAQVALEEAKTLGIAMVRDRNGTPKPAVIAFCPTHIDFEKRLTTQENETKHINADLVEIKGDVKSILMAVNK